MNLERAQQVLWEGLIGLESTGSTGFEGFLALVLQELTGLPFHGVKSGSQGGSDVRSDPSNFVHIALESKQYRPSTRLPLDALLYKLNDASRADPAPDLWIVASTRCIDASDREELSLFGDDLGIEVVVWDWPDGSDQLCSLAVVCGAAPKAWSAFFGESHEEAEAFEVVRAHADFESMASHWRERFLAPEIGYVNSQARSLKWLEEAQNTLANAKSRLGGHHDLKASKYGIVRRIGVNQQLHEWFSDRKSGIAALVGAEGMGKSWVALDWCNDLTTLLGSECPLIVFLPARRVGDTEAKTDLARSIAGQASQDERKSRDYWRRRLSLWERSNRNGVRILVVVDGINQNFLFRNWADWVQPLLDDSVGRTYSLLVTCWQTTWRDELLRLENLEPIPVEIEVGEFNDEELDNLLKGTDLRREDLSEELLPLMRVPRLSSVALEHREALTESGDITAERVIYEDWKDRIRRDGQSTGLNNARMKAFVADLGRQLRNNVATAITRKNILEILSHKSGQTSDELKSAISHLISGGWFREGDEPDKFKLDPSRVPYVLGVALMSELKRRLGSFDVGETIADFLDPLKAHSLGTKILRAAVTIALVETDTQPKLTENLVVRWLDEQNFSSEDFDALWRLAGLDPKLILGVAEKEWLNLRTSSFKDEVLIKTLANAAEFANFRGDLEASLMEWLGTAWPQSMEEIPEDNDGSDVILLESDDWQNLKSRLDDWNNSTQPDQFAPVRVCHTGNWAWLSSRALAVISYLSRVPLLSTLEAWALSRALAGSCHHFDSMAWVLRMNNVDKRESILAVESLVNRLERHSHETSGLAGKNLRFAMSHTRRKCEGVVDASPYWSEEKKSSENSDSELEGDSLYEAIHAFLGRNGWNHFEPHTGAMLIDQLIERGFPETGREIDLLSRKLGEYLTIITPRSRCLLQAAFERAQETLKVQGESQQSEPQRFGFMAFLLKLFGASAKKQSELLLASNHGIPIRDWYCLCRDPKEQDLQDRNIENASITGLKQWLAGVGPLLSKSEINELHFLSSLVRHPDVEIRRQAVQMAAYSKHREALVQFADSEFASSGGSPDKPDYIEEFARYDALVALESIQPGTVPRDRFSPQCAALRVKREDFSDSALDAFETYLINELESICTAREWSGNRYWFSYRECVKLLIERGGAPVEKKLGRLVKKAAIHTDMALMNDFPVLDTMRALMHRSPGVVIEAFQILKAGQRSSIFSKDIFDEFPFELPHTTACDVVCDFQLDSATTDKQLLDIVCSCYKNARTGWLLEHIECLEQSTWPADVAKAFTLLGFCDSCSAATALWDDFRSRPPEDEWLFRVFCESHKDFIRNQRARVACCAFWQCETEAGARHEWKLVEQNCDQRIGLWLRTIEPSVSDKLHVRQITRNLGVRNLNEAVRRDQALRKKSLFHTSIPHVSMSPWS